MSASFLITLREGFEAALIVAIVLAFVKRSDRPDMARSVWAGTLGAVALAVAVGLVVRATIEDLTGDVRARTFAAISFSAAALLTWMIFWMRTHARHLKKELEGKAGGALRENSARALALVAFTAVVREGLETALFLLSTSTSDSGSDVLIGAVLGLAVAGVLGVIVYQGAHLFNMRRFFQITGVLIIMLAAGLLAKGVLFLQGNTVDVVYNVTGVDWLTGDSEVGKFLAGIFGWDPAPSLLQFVVYVGFLLPALAFFFWDGPRKPVVAGPAPTGTDDAPSATPMPSAR